MWSVGSSLWGPSVPNGERNTVLMPAAGRPMGGTTVLGVHGCAPLTWPDRSLPAPLSSPLHNPRRRRRRLFVLIFVSDHTQILFIFFAEAREFIDEVQMQTLGAPGGS